MSDTFKTSLNQSKFNSEINTFEIGSVRIDNVYKIGGHNLNVDFNLLLILKGFCIQVSSIKNRISLFIDTKK